MGDVAFLVPGDLDRPTGGYRYDRQILGLLPRFGLRPTLVSLADRFPDPAPGDFEACAEAVSALPPGCLLLVDGLAYGVLPPDLIRRFARPVVALCHHPLALETGISLPRAAALAASERAALALADHVVATSPTTRRVLAAEYAVPGERITVAIPGTAPRPRATGSGGPRVEMLAVGAVVPRKGYDRLIAALARVAGHDWRLTIVGANGDRTHRAELDAAIAVAGLAGRIRFLGAVDEPILDELLSCSDLFVSASLYEGYGMGLAEAMAAGLPIVASTGGAAAETVPAGVALAVPPGDVDALADALDRALADPPLRRRLAEAARAAGRALPGWEDTAGRIAARLRALCRSAP